MSSTPIRQPRGPTPDSSFGTSTSSPPEADTGSHLRRNKSTSTSSTSTTFSSRHQGSASISTPASSLAFHGRGFRSGSLSSGSDLDIGNGPGVGVGVGVGVGGLVRKGSGRDVKKSVVVEENLEENMLDPAASTAGSWGKGLSRQSSLPSRRGKFFYLSSLSCERGLLLADTIEIKRLIDKYNQSSTCTSSSDNVTPSSTKTTTSYLSRYN